MPFPALVILAWLVIQAVLAIQSLGSKVELEGGYEGVVSYGSVVVHLLIYAILAVCVIALI